MKTTNILILSGLLLCGFLQKQVLAADAATDLVQVGKETAWQGGSVLRITKREGNSIEGIEIIITSSDGRRRLITANTGTLEFGSIVDAKDQNSVKLTLDGAHGQTFAVGGGKSDEILEVQDIRKMTIVLKR